MYNLSITQRITLLGSLIAIIVASVIGATAIYSAKTMTEKRMLESELPSKVESINKSIAQQILQLKSAAQQLSSNQFIVEMAKQGTLNEAMLVDELKRIARQYDLVTASWANRQSAQYWNQDGFLRVLNQQQDGWFFGFTQSAEPFSISIFQEAPGDVKCLLIISKQMALA